ncbi:MAG: glycosyl hydrolase 108 family protein [Chromatiales bacterium]|jgi:lysozyme family protein
MKENFASALKHVLVHEGGFANHPDDPGGATMKGVTLNTFRRHFGPGKTVEDLRNITQEQLAQVYRTGYWDKCRGDELPSGVDYAVFDSAVNSGPGRAARWLQAAVGAKSDGAIGPKTLSMVANHEPPVIINDLCDNRLAFLQGLDIFSTFGRGWTRRVGEVRRRALEMAGAATDTAELEPDVDFDTVRPGSSGEWVVKLQQALKIKADGEFGPKTEAAVAAFQEEHGLEVDGIAGRSTYRALGLID